MDRPAQTDHLLPRRFLRMCRRNLWRQKIADSSGAGLTGAGLLSGSLALRRLLSRQVLAADETYVGVLLPPCVGAVLVNAALAIDRRVAVNLNYTLSAEVLRACTGQCGIRHILTSRRLLTRFPLALDAEMVYVEDLRGRLAWADRLWAALGTWLLPAAALERQLGLTEIADDDLLTVMFTSGSTGQPKGVMLTQRNVASNLDAFDAVIRFCREDVLLGVLPLFHCFGYATTLWTALTMDPKAVYHYTPLEAREIGRLCSAHRATMLVAAPTFLRSYLRRCEPQDLRTLEVVIVGAERLPPALAAAFQERFGVRPVEGYGATELSPVVAVNVPPGRGPRDGLREGTVGRPLGGIALRLVDAVTGQPLPPGAEGLLLVQGPGVMKGYLGRPDLTAEVLHDGWYTTGDMATIDADGFLTITGRLRRFSKIGGEMVPHVRVEEAIAEALGSGAETPLAAVAAVPDPRRGERLVVLCRGLDVPPEEICRRLLQQGLPPLWIPSPDSFRQVESIPVLASGKLDLEKVRAMALAEFGATGE